MWGLGGMIEFSALSLCLDIRSLLVCLCVCVSDVFFCVVVSMKVCVE